MTMTAGVIEFSMIFALGALAALLVGLLAMPFLVRRAARLARSAAEKRLPMTLEAIAAERDGLRASHAVETRRLEQRLDGAAAAQAAAQADAGRQTTRLAASVADHARMTDTVAGLTTTLAEMRAKASEAGLMAEARAASLRDMSTLAEHRADLLAAATLRAAAAEQRVTVLEAERDAAPRREIPGVADPVTAPDREGGVVDADQDRAVARLKAEREMLRKDLTVAADDRDRLRLRIDELLLQLEEAQEKTEEAEELLATERRHAARLDRTIARQTERLEARTIAEVDRRLNQARAGAEGGVTDVASLRRAIATLSADLVRLATADAAAGEERPAARTPGDPAPL